MNVATARLCLLLHSIPALDDPSLARLLLHCGGPSAALDAGPGAWRDLGLAAAARAGLTRARRGDLPDPSIDVDAQLQAMATVAADVIPVTARRYPPLLRTIHDPPPLLYVRGAASLLGEAQLAVVGSRKASPAGLRAAHTLSRQAASAGLSICSGLALGIDSAAHRGALAGGGRSVAVMATGIERIYPHRHRQLAAELEQSGCLVTEFPPGTPPLRHNFPRRNRIISGLSLGVLVVEAALPSGSLITAGTALEQGREVCALPWSMWHAGGAGCLRLIRDGARMVQGIEDVLEELGSLYTLQQDLLETQAGPGDAECALPRERRELLGLVGFEAIPADELVHASSLPVARVLEELTALELSGLIVRCAGGYIRC